MTTTDALALNIKDAKLLTDVMEKVKQLHEDGDKLGRVLRAFSVKPSINMWGDLYGSYSIIPDGTLVAHYEVRNGDCDNRGYAVVRITPEGDVTVKPTSSYGLGLGHSPVSYIDRVARGLDLLRDALG